jgi:hypothetical protein
MVSLLDSRRHGRHVLEHVAAHLVVAAVGRKERRRQVVAELLAAATAAAAERAGGGGQSDTRTICWPGGLSTAHLALKHSNAQHPPPIRGARASSSADCGTARVLWVAEGTPGGSARPARRATEVASENTHGRLVVGPTLRLRRAAARTRFSPMHLGEMLRACASVANQEPLCHLP